MIALVDLDAFFAQIEQLENPQYRGKPVIIGGRPGGRGVVATASYEARTFGVHSAMPTNTAYRLCPDGIFLRGDMAKYSDYSRRIFEALHDVTPVVEKASVDEFYLDLSGMEKLSGSAKEIGTRCKAVIKEATGLTCSIGIGPNRLIAKLASEYRKPDGLTVVSKNQINRFLDALPLKAMRGIGPKTLKRIAKLNVETIGQLRERYTLEALKQAVGERTGSTLYHQARGSYPERAATHKPQHSISKETTFSEDISDPQQLKQVMQKLAFNVARSLRKKGKKGGVVNIRVCLGDFSTYTRQQKLTRATDSDAEIARFGWELFKQNDYVGKALRLIGIGVVVADELPAMEESENIQIDLFAQNGVKETDDVKSDGVVTTAMDEILDKFGEGSIRRGGR
ncbi:hypothetical protein BOW53_12440 [Solemya pervernicosa gill symbiont]|uniref:DNA polymerase IV n=1 Tax=Solemya pervernicosa gill symbiont TaxID=642797 RepID=A0A1T2L2G6_9GAMM|nr:hypothetical protein BOW53_12440 [Solemya pervernicosa gill symbiont]